MFLRGFRGALRTDGATAAYLKGVVSDGVIAPGFEPGTFETLAAKKGGSFVMIEIDPGHRPPPVESREVFGVTLVQDRNDRRVTLDDLNEVVCGKLNDAAKRDLVVGLVALKYTQSNSVCYIAGGQTIGIGAGQQSRVDCTKLAGAKADVWHLCRSPMVLDLAFRRGVRRQDRINWRVRYIEGDLTADEEAAFEAALEEPAGALDAEARHAWFGGLTDVALASDGYLPFRDNVDHAATHGVRYIVQPGGSARDGEVEAACREYGMALVHTGIRLYSPLGLVRDTHQLNTVAVALAERLSPPSHCAPRPGPEW